MIMVLENCFHGLPRYVGVLELTEAANKSGCADMLQNWKEKPVGSFAHFRPWAVMLFFWFGKAFLARIWQFWNIAVASPKMKSTVPLILQSRKNWRMECV
jgi:hypothetical protein